MTQNDESVEQIPEKTQDESVENYLKNIERNIFISKMNLGILLLLIFLDGARAIYLYMNEGLSFMFFLYLVLVFMLTFTFGYVQLSKENMEFNKELISLHSKDIKITIYKSVNEDQ